MSGLLFEWDPAKERANRRKHDIGFAEASTVFGDPFSITISDSTEAEQRLIIIGMSNKRNVLIVVHTVRHERIRLISARPATKHERRSYEESADQAPFH